MCYTSPLYIGIKWEVISDSTSKIIQHACGICFVSNQARYNVAFYSWSLFSSGQGRHRTKEIVFPSFKGSIYCWIHIYGSLFPNLGTPWRRASWLKNGYNILDKNRLETLHIREYTNLKERERENTLIEKF